MVMFNAVNILSGEGGDGSTGSRIQECWEFVHPVKSVVLNDRGGTPEVPLCIEKLKRLDFRAPCDKQP